VTDRTGGALQWKKEVLSETRISWTFPPVSNGDMTVIVRFRIPNALTGDIRGNFFDASWIKTFRVKVTDATYRFILPKGFQPEKFSLAPHSFTIGKFENGRVMIEAKDAVVRAGYFGVSFSPGLVDQPKGALRRVISTYSRRAETPAEQIRNIFIILVILILIFSRGCSVKKDSQTNKWKLSYTLPTSDSGSSSGCGGCGGCGG